MDFERQNQTWKKEKGALGFETWNKKNSFFGALAWSPLNTTEEYQEVVAVLTNNERVHIFHPPKKLENKWSHFFNVTKAMEDFLNKEVFQDKFNKISFKERRKMLAATSLTWTSVTKEGEKRQSFLLVCTQAGTCVVLECELPLRVETLSVSSKFDICKENYVTCIKWVEDINLAVLGESNGTFSFWAKKMEGKFSLEKVSINFGSQDARAVSMMEVKRAGNQNFLLLAKGTKFHFYSFFWEEKGINLEEFPCKEELLSKIFSQISGIRFCSSHEFVINYMDGNLLFFGVQQFPTKQVLGRQRYYFKLPQAELFLSSHALLVSPHSYFAHLLHNLKDINKKSVFLPLILKQFNEGEILSKYKEAER